MTRTVCAGSSSFAAPCFQRSCGQCTAKRTSDQQPRPGHDDRRRTAIAQLTAHRCDYSLVAASAAHVTCVGGPHCRTGGEQSRASHHGRLRPFDHGRGASAKRACGRHRATAPRLALCAAAAFAGSVDSGTHSGTRSGTCSRSQFPGTGLECLGARRHPARPQRTPNGSARR